jgi:hypothetical protein
MEPHQRHIFCHHHKRTLSKPTAYILDRFASRNSNYSSWLHECPVACEIVEQFPPAWTPPRDAGILITHMHYRWEEINTLRRVLEAGRVPILILADGVIEFRNTFINPTIPHGSIFQPVIGHKLACIGRGQARVVESWGNVGKCEIVGLPRFDDLLDRECIPVNEEGPFRLLVATATTPAFTATQREFVLKSLTDLRDRIRRNPWVNRRRLEVHWRLTDGLANELGIEEQNRQEPGSISLESVIESSDAVITTPSTLYFESVMKRRPTAILDYGNHPQYFSPAWTISAPAHIAPVLDEMSNPTPAKMQFQRSVLHDQLECASAAKPRLFALINSMVESGNEAKRKGESLHFPTRILTDPQRGIQVVESEFDNSMLYPDGKYFYNENVLQLQSELSQAIHRLEQLPLDLHRKNCHIDDMEAHLDQAEQRISEYRDKVDHLMSVIDQKNEYLARKNEHIQSMQQHLQEALARNRELVARLAGNRNDHLPESPAPDTDDESNRAA